MRDQILKNPKKQVVYKALFHKELSPIKENHLSF